MRRIRRDIPSSGGTAPRTVGLLLLCCAAIAIATAWLLGGGDSHHYRISFLTGGQLVPGNEVLVAGQRFGLVDQIELTDDRQAEVTISTDEPLRLGTVAAVRLTSLSGVANRYISLQLGPNNAPEIADGALIDGERTTTPVDLDQLFNTLRRPEREALGKIIHGQATVYAGAGEAARGSYKYLGPGLSSTTRLLSELNRDDGALSRFLVEGSQVFGAVGERRRQLTSLISGANQALGAVASQSEALDRSLAILPDLMRQGNTTFVNLRAALDDLDPLVSEAKPATRDLAPFLDLLRPVARRGVGVFDNLDRLAGRPGPANDLADTFALTTRLADAAEQAVPPTLDALDDSQPLFEFARPYAPDVLGFVAKLGQATAYYDADGHYVRLMPAHSNVFSYNPGTQQLDPTYSDPAQQALGLSYGRLARCPGAASQPAFDGSSPFLDDGNLSAYSPPAGGGDCDPTAVLAGP